MSDSEVSSLASPTSTLNHSDVSDQASEPEIPRQNSTKFHTSPQAPLRPARSRRVPMKLRDAETEPVQAVDLSRSVIVKCSQTSKKLTAKPMDLHPDSDEPLSRSHLVPGCRLMLDESGKHYPVQFVCFADEKKSKKKEDQQKRERKTKESHGERHVENHKSKDKAKGRERSATRASSKRSREDEPNLQDILMKAREDTTEPLTKRNRHNEVTCTNLDEEDKDLILNLARKVEKMENTLMKVYKLIESLPESLPSGSGASQHDIKSESPEYIVNGVNILRLSARDVYAFGLQLLDILFTKEEQSRSLLFSSKKSSKPGLDRERVDRLLGYMDKRFGCEWELKKFIQKANQKCRDVKLNNDENEPPSNS